MLPKASIVSIGVHDDVLNWVAKHKPVSILIVNERGQSRPGRPWENNEIDRIRATMATSPKTLWIFRSWPDGMGEVPTMELALRLRKCLEPFMDLSNPKMGHSFNEPGFPWIQASGDARKLAIEEKFIARAMHDVGLLSMNFCFSESHLLKGNMGLWHIFAEALPYVDALGFNEYDWPNWDTSRDQGYKWRIGHWEHQLDRISQAMGTLDQIPPVIMGEGILDGKIQYPHPHGWQKKRPYSPRRYVDAHQAVYDDTYHRPEVFAHHTFCYCHRSSEWNSYNVKPILHDLGQLIENQVYWEDYHKEEKMEQPIRVLGVGTMDLEAYLTGVLPREMGKDAPMEALKAQAVAARCYALNAIKNPRHAPDADICASTHCQVWKPIYHERTDRAVEATKGVVAIYNGKVISAFYFGHCDGHTRNCEDVWVQALPYCRAVDCPCGYTEMYGHGVGMCQRGAIKMAEQGASYKDILFHYYTGIETAGEKRPKPAQIQEALLEIAKAKAKMGGIPHLVKEAEDGLEAATKMLSGEDR